MALINSKKKESFDDLFLFFLLLLSFCFWSHNHNDNMSVFFFVSLGVWIVIVIVSLCFTLCVVWYHILIWCIRKSEVSKYIEIINILDLMFIRTISIRAQNIFSSLIKWHENIYKKRVHTSDRYGMFVVVAVFLYNYYFPFNFIVFTYSINFISFYS